MINTNGRSGSLDIPTAPITVIPGTYTTRRGEKVQITDKDGMYVVGRIQTSKGRRLWRWFENGESYGNDMWDDITGA